MPVHILPIIRGLGRRPRPRLAVSCVLALLWVWAPADARADAEMPFIDAHTHIVRSTGHNPRGPEQTAPAALAVMDRLGVTLSILAPPPFPPDRRGEYGLPELQKLAREHPGRFAFTAGGESLNPMIQDVAPANVTPGVLRDFEAEAEKIARSGAAGFGELAAEHFSSRRGNHPYESSPPDHPLFLALADIAAKYDMPIELHMEALPRDMPFPKAELAGAPNPATVKENIAAFERLLDHNPKARIVWVHAGWDLSGERTVLLMRSLMERHPNLFMSVKIDRGGLPMHSPFRPDGSLKPPWIGMLLAFRERFVVGSDQFYDQGSGRSEHARAFVDALPAEAASLIAGENVKRIYRLAGPAP